MTKARADLALFEAPFSKVEGRVSPKRPRIEQAGIADVFPYYAGFSFEWAMSELAALVDTPDSVVLDPWNGSGTTTLAAAQLGLPAIGVDLHPVANLVSEARIAETASVAEGLAVPCSDIEPGASVRHLEQWFTPASAARIGQWVASINYLDRPARVVATLAIFRAVRSLTKRFEGSNPTWVRRARAFDDLVAIDSDAIDETITSSYSWMYMKFINRQDVVKRRPKIVLASAGRLPIRDASIQRVVTSPPYLTRIDYGVAYARELAVMGIDLDAYRTLRSALTGTTLIRGFDSDFKHRHNPIAVELVKAVASHGSKDSAGYYRKQLSQYLSDLTSAVRELARVAAVGAQMTVVVQDSYYKDIEVRLADLFVAEARHWGWATVGVEKFVVNRLLTTLNTPARAYNKGDVAESVIRLERRDCAS